MKQKSQQRPSGGASWQELEISSCVYATGVVPGVSGGQVFQSSSCLQHLAHILGFNITLLQVVDLPSPLWLSHSGVSSLIWPPPPQRSLTAFHFLSLCQCFGSGMILVLIIISLTLNLSGLKSRGNDGVSRTCVLSCVQQGATPLGVFVQKLLRRERASCSVKLFAGEFLVSGCILSLTEKNIKFILWISAHQRQQGGLFGGIYCLCKDTQEPPLTPHSDICSQRSNHIHQLPQASVTLKADSGPCSTPLNPAVETSGPLLRSSSSSCFVSVVVFKIPLSVIKNKTPLWQRAGCCSKLKQEEEKIPALIVLVPVCAVGQTSREPPLLFC